MPCAARVERPLALAGERHFGDVRFQHRSALQRLPDGAWRTVWKFSTARCGEVLEEAVQSFPWLTISAAEVHELLGGAGFVAENRCSGFDGAAFTEGESGVLLVVARKALPCT